ncbi:MAG: sensor histidine kinase [bacterium]
MDNPRGTFKVPDNEADRIQRLKNYHILDSPSEPSFDNLTKLAVDIFEMPIAIIGLIDSDRQWHKSYVGFDFEELDRACSFCNDLLIDNQVMTIEDARNDPRVSDNPIVTGDPYIRSYAGAPIETEDGYILGAFCVLDREPRSFSETERNILRGLANEAMTQINLRYENEERRRTNQQMQEEIKHYEEQLYEKNLEQEELLHRAKNHFSQVKSLLSLQKSKLTDPDNIRALELAEIRLHAFVSIYDQLNKAKESLTINSNQYLSSISSNILKVFDDISPPISIEQNIEDLELSSDNALKFGLALNELMTNAYKHVFLPKLGSRLILIFGARGDELVLSVEDDGPGLSSKDQSDGNPPQGLNILQDIIEYDGKGSVDYREDNGAIFTVRIPRAE